jgi:hypothetical protein
MRAIYGSNESAGRIAVVKDTQAGHAEMTDDVADGVTDFRERGQTRAVRAARVAGATVMVTGKALKVATVKDEQFLAGDPVADPPAFISALNASGLKADLFVFLQKPPMTGPQHDYHIEWDNFAAVSTVDFDDWWTNHVPQETRKNVRRARNRGVEVRTVELSEDVVRGIHEIYNESPMRQGKRFYHYGKDIDTVRRELSTFGPQSEFIGAFVGDELIGFMKIVHMGPVSSIMHIVSKNAHMDKRPTNALLAESIAVCNRRGVQYLLYGQYTYGRKGDDSLTLFKRRNGFEKINFPRYYVPLTLKGRVALALGLHRDLIEVLPAWLWLGILSIRANALKAIYAARGIQPDRNTATAADSVRE